ncbi:MAG: SDR family oxidoreductase [Rhodospirillales bacterium]|nr:SDR family oxidoreductase [Rhodospirillales bacterium]
MTGASKFSLKDRVAVITGGAGLLGTQHAEAIAEAGGVPVLWDIDGVAAEREAHRIRETYATKAQGMNVDITDPASVAGGLADVVKSFGRVHILINNAANDPKVGPEAGTTWSRFENFSIDMWQQDMAVGLTGAFLCSQAVGAHMAQKNGGVILNIASDLSVIAPDQRLYRQEGLADDEQPVKPVSYSVVKHGLIGLTKYLSTYWADKGVRCNAISPGGVYTDQPEEFVQRLDNLIPMGRMAEKDEYKGAIVFLCSDASSYMTGQNLVMDGGRSVL